MRISKRLGYANDVMNSVVLETRCDDIRKPPGEAHVNMLLDFIR
jgi:hypothetical protein